MCADVQVVRHERASIKADIWSYGILIWELITGEDITEYQPLSISRQVWNDKRIVIHVRIHICAHCSTAATP